MLKLKGAIEMLGELNHARHSWWHMNNTRPIQMMICISS